MAAAYIERKVLNFKTCSLRFLSCIISGSGG